MSLFRLESVSLFRAEIMREASTNFFKERDQWKPKVEVRKVRGQDNFPQPYHRRKIRDRNDPRHKTQPITIRELNEVPESEALTNAEITERAADISRAQEAVNRAEEDAPETVTQESLVVPSAVDIPLTPLVDSEEIPMTPMTPLEEANLPIAVTPKAKKRNPNVSNTSDQSSVESDDDFDKLVEINYKEIISSPTIEKKLPPVEDIIGKSEKRTNVSERKQRLERSKTQPLSMDDISRASEISRTEHNGHQGGRPKSMAFSDEENASGSEDELSK